MANQITLDLPDELYLRLQQTANSMGQSLNQYLVYSLSRQVSMGKYVVQPVPVGQVEAETKEFQEFLASAPKATPEEIKQVLGEREYVAPESELDPEAVKHLEEIIQNR